MIFQSCEKRTFFIDITFKGEKMKKSSLIQKFERYNNICKVYAYYLLVLKNLIIDVSSKDLFMLRLKWIKHHDDLAFLKYGVSKGNNYSILDFVDYSGSVVLWTGGRYFEYTKLLLENSDMKHRFRVESNVEKIELSLGEKILWDPLLPSSISEEKLFRPIDYDFIYALCGKQYMDILNPYREELIVDAGSFDGTTTVEFNEWANKKNNIIYTFDPNKENIPLIEKNIHPIINEQNGVDIRIVDKGLWSESKVLFFSSQNIGGTGKVGGLGDIRVPVTSLDELNLSNQVTLIKMDIEGSEIEALKGAKKIIQRDKPTLAICVYHKHDDLFQIPRLIRRFSKDYRFAFRHYSSWDWETVLYAIPKQEIHRRYRA